MSVSSHIASNGMEPMPLSPYTPSTGSQKAAPTETPASAPVSSTEAQDPNAPSALPADQQAASEDDDFSFWDVLDMVNPLQHIPIVSSIYRELTGDSIKDISRVVGSTLLGGPIGAAVALVDVGINQTTGKHVDEHVMAMIKGDGANQTGTAVVNAPDDGMDAATNTATNNGESSYNFINQINTQRRGGTVEVRAVGGQQAAAPAAAAPAAQAQAAQSATPQGPLPVQASPLATPQAKPLTASSMSPVQPQTAQASGQQTAQASEQSTGKALPTTQGRRFTLNRARDVRQGETKPMHVENEYPTINKTQIRQSTPTTYGATSPEAAALAASMSNAQPAAQSAASPSSLPLSLMADDGAGASSAAAGGSETSSLSPATLPMGMLAPQTSMVPDGSAQPSSDALYKAMQAQGLQPTQHPMLADAKASETQAAQASHNLRRQSRKAISAADSAEMGTAVMPPSMTTPSASAAAASYSQTAAATAAPMTLSGSSGAQANLPLAAASLPTASTPAQPATTVASAAPTSQQGQLPGWYEQAMQKALNTYEKTGSFSGAKVSGTSSVE